MKAGGRALRYMSSASRHGTSTRHSSSSSSKCDTSASFPGEPKERHTNTAMPSPPKTDRYLLEKRSRQPCRVQQWSAMYNTAE